MCLKNATADSTTPLSRNPRGIKYSGTFFTNYKKYEQKLTSDDHIKYRYLFTCCKPANTLTHLKCIDRNFVVHKEGIHLGCNHIATGIKNFNFCDVNVQSHDIGAITRERIVENNRPKNSHTSNQFKDDELANSQQSVYISVTTGLHKKHVISHCVSNKVSFYSCQHFAKYWTFSEFYFTI